jgi:hypothetical protein
MKSCVEVLKIAAIILRMKIFSVFIFIFFFADSTSGS